MWDELTREYREIITFFNSFSVPSQADWDLRILSLLTYGQVENPMASLPPDAEWIYSPDVDRRAILRIVGYELGLCRDLPEGWQPFAAAPPVIDYDFIGNSIKQRRCSADLVREWGRLKELNARYLELIHNSDRVNAESGQAEAGALEGHRIQHHWYAHWVRSHSDSLKPSERSRAERSLTETCFGIATGQLLPARPYNREWFAKMLDDREQAVVEQLKSSYQRLSAEKLSRLLADERVRPCHLPPLRFAEFRHRA